MPTQAKGAHHHRGAEEGFLDYTHEELDQAYDQRNWAPNAEALIALSPMMSAETRKRLRFTSHNSGASPDETLDVFPTDDTSAPVAIFIHGGSWRSGTKEDYSFVADAFVPAGGRVAFAIDSGCGSMLVAVLVSTLAGGFAFDLSYLNALSSGALGRAGPGALIFTPLWAGPLLLVPIPALIGLSIGKIFSRRKARPGDKESSTASRSPASETQSGAVSSNTSHTRVVHELKGGVQVYDEPPARSRVLTDISGSIELGGADLVIGQDASWYYRFATPAGQPGYLRADDL